MIFHVINNGDWDVGLSGWSLEVEVKGDLEGLTDDVSEFEKRMKDFLMAEFGEGDGVTHVMTQKEIDDMVQDEDAFNEGE